MDFKYCMENPTYVRLIMWENLNHAKFFNKDELTVSKGEILNWVKKIVEDAEKEGRLMKSIDAKQLLLTLYACCFNYFTNMNTLSGIIGCDLMKDEEIYNIFNTKKILNRAPGVTVSKTSGAAGIAYWINEHYGLSEEKKLSKNDDLVKALKEWVDEMYADGRTTSLANSEIENKIRELTDDKEFAK